MFESGENMQILRLKFLKPSPKSGLWLFLFLFIFSACQTTNQKTSNWSTYKADSKSSSYSALKQVNKSNVNQLELAWTFRFKDALPGAR
ncbi:MAG TPA: hypothetical protein PLT16_00950, partial [Daejeonella sp.]|nr:hypothetical protein [Daejeonella sp.]